MRLEGTPLAGLQRTQSDLFEDARGWFYRGFCDGTLDLRIRQVNVSLTLSAGTVRGLHYQQGETKMVRCLRGEIWDVVLDLRQGSPTLLRWHAERLTPENRTMLVIPPGCAHGFQALTDDCQLLYLTTESYDPSREGAVRFDDPACAIDWPLPPRNLSQRDREHPYLEPGFAGL